MYQSKESFKDSPLTTLVMVKSLTQADHAEAPVAVVALVAVVASVEETLVGEALED